MSSLYPHLDGSTLTSCAQVVQGRILGDGSVLISGVTLDSRTVRDGDLYAALPGANVHGADFAAAAQASGAAAILTDEAGVERVSRAEVGLPILVVADPRADLGAISAHVYGTAEVALRTIGITGTNGKTTTAYLLVSALEALHRTTGLIGTVETRIGPERVKSVRTTPESCDLHRLLALMTERGIDDCVMEVSSHALALHRVDGVRYDIALFTNLSQDHLDFHADMEEYFATKASLFTPERARRAVVCVGDAWGRRLAQEATIPVVTVGEVTDADGQDEPDYLIEHVAPGASDVPGGFTLTGPGRIRLELRSALPGGFNILNTAMAAVTLLELGHEPRSVQEAVLTDPHVPGRMERIMVDHPEAPLAVVDYAHTPDAVRLAAASLRAAERPGPVIVVLGAGGERDIGKRHSMGLAAASEADIVIVTDDNPRGEDPAAIRAAVMSGARAAGTAAVIEEVAGRRSAIRRAVEIACTAPELATIAVVGKGHETGQEVLGVVHPFDDRVELREALEATLRSVG